MALFISIGLFAERIQWSNEAQIENCYLCLLYFCSWIIVFFWRLSLIYLIRIPLAATFIPGKLSEIIANSRHGSPSSPTSRKEAYYRIFSWIPNDISCSKHGPFCRESSRKYQQINDQLKVFEDYYQREAFGVGQIIFDSKLFEGFLYKESASAFLQSPYIFNC